MVIICNQVRRVRAQNISLGALLSLGLYSYTSANEDNSFRNHIR